MSELNKLEQFFKSGKISRREFLNRAAALGMAAAVTPILLESTAHSATPKKGGLFRQALGGGSTTDSLDPSTTDNYYPVNVGYQIRNLLVEIDHDLIPQPELAESWDASPDATEWTFKLRRGIEFHNGKTFEAEDVLYSLNYHRGEESKSAAKAILSSIKEIKADGKHTVIIKLESGNADFPVIMSDVHLLIVPAGTKGAEFNKGIGTGGYILNRFEPGVTAETKRNPNYWKEGRAHFDEVETLNIADSTARTNSLLTGRVEYINRCELKTIDLLKKSKGIKVLRTPSSFHLTYPMLTDVPPYDNNDVRLALKYAMDRVQILQILLRGYGTVGNDHPIAPINRYHASDLPLREYDPDKAKYHLKKAGMEGHTFKLHTSTELGLLDSAQLYQQHAAKAGINVQIVQEPVDGFWSNVWMKKPFCSCYWAGRPTEDAMFNLVYAADAAFNDTHWKHERFNKLLLEARAELNDSKRREMYAEMQRIVRDEGGAIVFAFKDYVEAHKEKLAYGKVAGNLPGDGCRNAERWWFRS